MNDTYTLIAERHIAAPAERIWGAWHDPEKMARWWGPAGFRSTVKELDVREGGRFDIVMHGPDGIDYPNLYIFDRVEPFNQLIYTNAGSAEFDLAPYQAVVDMKEAAGRTRVTLTMRFVSEEEKRKHIEDFGAVEGAGQLLQRLEEQAAV